ncbi:unnamed protein product [Schistosoma turkestanicum]|nr:unnamed protein product [Schistosoma turkestanicum]
MTYAEKAPELMNAKCNFIRLDDVSNIRPLYKNKILNSCRPTDPAEQQSNGAVLDSSTDFLGYDWIASMVDNQMKPVCANNSGRPKILSPSHYAVNEEWLNQQELFDRLDAFRQTNSDICCSQQPLNLHKPSSRTNYDKSTFINLKQRVRPLPPIRTNISSHNDSNLKPPTTLVQNYTLNSRLFPVRTDVPVCDEKYEEETDGPIILRISIPSNRLKKTKFLNESLNMYKKYNSSSRSYPLKNTISLMGHCNYSMESKHLC